MNTRDIDMAVRFGGALVTEKARDGIVTLKVVVEKAARSAEPSRCYQIKTYFQNIEGSAELLDGSRLVAWTSEVNFPGSRIGNTACCCLCYFILLFRDDFPWEQLTGWKNAQSRFPSSVYSLKANPLVSLTVSAEPFSPAVVEKRTISGVVLPFV